MNCFKCHRPIRFASVVKAGEKYHPSCAARQGSLPIAGRQLRCECGKLFVAPTNYNNGCPSCADIYRRTCDGRKRNQPVGSSELKDGLAWCGKASRLVLEDDFEPWWVDAIRLVNALYYGQPKGQTA